jgi:channel protein (hemolysin III family)
VFSVVVFGMTMLLMYLASTLYHALPGPTPPRHRPTPLWERPTPLWERPTPLWERSPDREPTAQPPSPPRTRGVAKRVFRLLDHSAIYLLIAGTYTPFALGAFREDWGWPMFALVWGLAMAGVVLKCLAGTRHPVLSTLLYLAMGWLVVAAAEPLFTRLPPSGLAWLAAGGVAYTLGVVLFVLDDRVRYAHFAWHLFVLAGTACHFWAVVAYA